MPLEAVSAINYIDNDGRFLVVELVHSLALLGFSAECNNICVHPGTSGHVRHAYSSGNCDENIWCTHLQCAGATLGWTLSGTGDAPAAYVQHAFQAAANQIGTLEIFSTSIATSPAMAPPSLREHFQKACWTTLS